jgi:hypothetical protein
LIRASGRDDPERRQGDQRALMTVCSGLDGVVEIIGRLHVVTDALSVPSF